jgi:hypothetical protein
LNTEEHGEAESLLPGIAMHHALDSVAELENIEVDKQTYADSAQAHVGEDLGFVCRVESVDGLHFYNHSFLHDQVDAVSSSFRPS